MPTSEQRLELRVPTQRLITPELDWSQHLNRSLEGELRGIYRYMKAPVLAPYAFIPDVLKPQALESLRELPIPENGKCDPEVVFNHPVAGPLARTMGRISLMNRYYQFDPNKVVASLRNETGSDVNLGLHRDLLDGHAVIYNYDVDGDMEYNLDGNRFELINNEIVVINGSADWLDVTLYSGKAWGPDSSHFGGVTIAHNVVGYGPTSRNRLLVYANGQDTKLTQIPVDETGEAPIDEYYLSSPLSMNLRPELPRYGESRWQN